MRLEICSYSGYKIYPSKGKLYARNDSKVFRFINAKCESYHFQRLAPRKIDWTVFFRRTRRKGQTETTVKKQKRKIVKKERGIQGIELAELKAKIKPPAPGGVSKSAAAGAKKKAKGGNEEKPKAKKTKPQFTTNKGAKVPTVTKGATAGGPKGKQR
eukprot:TRINITY_DN38318_c0_g1_i1.p1 TRINITY_DN38318_c0_g1~~TRINITY_DN38318_c0_g1_i1.p1  ORF type:complete len:157 (-),score=19.55 TRINITY_DN38318_c0_g1_i1:449-919(-)